MNIEENGDKEQKDQSEKKHNEESEKGLSNFPFENRIFSFEIEPEQSKDGVKTKNEENHGPR